MRFCLRALIAAALALWLLPLAPAGAGIVSVTPSPFNFNVAMNQATAVTINWRIVRAIPPGPGTVVSSFGTLTIAGTTITINRALSRPTSGAEQVVIVETLVVPRSLLVRAIKSGAPLTGTYVRIFTEAGTTQVATVTFDVTTGGAASFGISRLDLKFLDDDSRATVRATDSRLRAVARIRFTGTGLLQASWQIATPTSTPGNEIYRPLRLERRQLAGNGEVELISPLLPTRIGGQYLVQLVIEDPGIGFDAPRLIYTVLPPGEPVAETAPQSIRVSAPAAAAALSPGTKIAWTPSPAAAVYRILIIEPAGEPLDPPQADLEHGALPHEPPAEAGRVVAGFYMPGNATEAALPGLVASRLTGGTRYLLKIQALDGSGVPIAESRPQETFWP
jgi:hypothetical protein